MAESEITVSQPDKTDLPLPVVKPLNAGQIIRRIAERIRPGKIILFMVRAFGNSIDLLTQANLEVVQTAKKRNLVRIRR